MPEPLQIALAVARSEEQAARMMLVEMLEQHGRRLSETAARVAGGYKPNDLGEDQGTGARIDVACARLDAAARKVEEVERIASEMASPTT